VAEFFLDYASFFLKTATLVVGIGLLLIAVLTARKSASNFGVRGDLQVINLNKVLRDLTCEIEQEVLSQNQLKKKAKDFAKAHKKEQKEESGEKSAQGKIMKTVTRET